jgi:undecaprenyl-diphosphatase
MSEQCGAGLAMGFQSLSYGKIAFLGVIQGVTELLPISSTAHMRVIPTLLAWGDPGSAFSAAMQLAALAAVISYFWTDISQLASGASSAVARRQFGDPNFKLLVAISIATLPIVLAGILLSPYLNRCDSPLRALPVIGWACIIMAALMALTEIFARHRRTVAQSSLLDATLVGLAQVGALIPGVSRSGATLTATLGLGFKRAEAARLSFLLGVPAIALAGLKELWELHKAHLSNHGWSLLIVGLSVASLSAFLAIWLLMRVLERFSTWIFVCYRGALGIFLIVASAYGSLR